MVVELALADAGGAGREGLAGFEVFDPNGDASVLGAGGGVSGFACGDGLGVAAGDGGGGGGVATAFGGGGGGLDAGFAGGTAVDPEILAGTAGEAAGESVGFAGVDAESLVDESFGGGGRRGSDAMKSSVGARTDMACAISSRFSGLSIVE